jgi:hypothetical protein
VTVVCRRPSSPSIALHRSLSSLLCNHGGPLAALCLSEGLDDRYRPYAAAIQPQSCYNGESHAASTTEEEAGGSSHRLQPAPRQLSDPAIREHEYETHAQEHEGLYQHRPMDTACFQSICLAWRCWCFVVQHLHPRCAGYRGLHHEDTGMYSPNSNKDVADMCSLAWTS